MIFNTPELTGQEACPTRRGPLPPQITVLDAGGQYCHLIARKVRDLGVYAEVVASETPASQLTGRRGIIVSGGPSSVYDPGSPTLDPATLRGASVDFALQSRGSSE